MTSCMDSGPLNRMGIVYRVFEDSTGKSYIGQTKRSLKKRLAHFESMSGHGGHLLMADMKNKGADKFSAEILFESDDQNQLDTIEKLMIIKYNSIYPLGYNIQRGGLNQGGIPKRKVIDNTTGVVYESEQEASVHTGIGQATISESCTKGSEIRQFSGRVVSFSFVE